ncbi:hypothetical protein [Methylobacterium sp. SI9]|uniref:hypothetical protein n=1 Tax=Methylobacterium guangdongense TaxID=3138811 RepID=UPI00313B0734
MTAELAPTNLHTLAVSLEALQRLLERRTTDGRLVSVDPGLIGAAIEAGYEEVRRIRATLATIPDEPTAPWRRSVEILNAAVSQISDLLDTLEEMLGYLDG